VNMTDVRRALDSRFEKLTASEKLTLIALLFTCDESGGNIYSSVETLAANTNVGRKQAQANLKKLERIGYLKTVGDAPGGNFYATKMRRLNLPLIFQDAKHVRLSHRKKSDDQDPSTETAADLRGTSAFSVLRH
jgi:DNA-binding IscR family transcriptional regulator